MKKNATAVPTTSFQFLEPIHAKPQIIIIIMGQGELINNFSNFNSIFSDTVTDEEWNKTKDQIKQKFQSELFDIDDQT